MKTALWLLATMALAAMLRLGRRMQREWQKNLRPLQQSGKLDAGNSLLIQKPAEKDFRPIKGWVPTVRPKSTGQPGTRARLIFSEPCSQLELQSSDSSEIQNWSYGYLILAKKKAPRNGRVTAVP